MRKTLIFVAMTVAVLVLLPGGASGAAGGTERPFKALASGSVTTNQLTGHVQATGVGVSTHLGLTAMEEHGQMAPTGPQTLAYSGLWTGTAANGDTLVATSAGTVNVVDATHFTAVYVYTVVGGTGRFATATGTFTARGEFVRVSADGAITTALWNFTVAGRLNF